MNRTDFEAAYIERYGHRPRGWNDDFQVYQDAHANGAWFGWQARAAGIEPKAAPVGEREAFETYLNDCVKHGIEPSPAGAFVFAYQAGAAHQRQQVTDWHPSGADYDRRIHSNPDAKAWADLFIATFPGLADKHDLMLAWFSNAMMAMHDWIKSQASAAQSAPAGERGAFQREERYTVIKHKDLTFDDRAELDQLIHSRHIPTRECLVIESDWPEYEPAWRMIEARVTGAAHQRQQAREVVMPERKVAQHGDVLSFQGEGWNACLDEFARLNGKEVGRG